MAAKTTDFTKMMSDMMSAYPMDMSAMTDAFKTSAAMGEKMSKVILDAAEKSTDISSKWTKDTIASWPMSRPSRQSRPTTPSR